MPERSQDFGYSLGVLHQVPDTGAAMRACVKMLKPGNPFLGYLCFPFGKRTAAFRVFWNVSERVQAFVSRMEFAVKPVTTGLVEACFYSPLARLNRVLAAAGLTVSGWPLPFYCDRSFYTMRTDSRDRFGTLLKQRFSRCQAVAMMESRGLTAIEFSSRESYWCAVGRKT